jgi:multicomponent Na+:H+ antiporter subunit C
MLAYILCFLLILIGFYAILVKKNTIKIILGVLIIDYGINLFLILTGYRKKGIVPVVFKDTDISGFAAKAVDPLPQAMVLTSIVIGLSVTLLLVAVSIRLYEKYGTFDVDEMKRLKG